LSVHIGVPRRKHAATEKFSKKSVGGGKIEQRKRSTGGLPVDLKKDIQVGKGALIAGRAVRVGGTPAAGRDLGRGLGRPQVRGISKEGTSNLDVLAWMQKILEKKRGVRSTPGKTDLKGILEEESKAGNEGSNIKEEGV